MKRAFVALLFVVCFVIGLAPIARAQLLSPGPLSKAHASIDGDAHCSDCHSSGKRVDQKACLKCHTEIQTRLNAGQGLHGRQFKTSPCEQCHVEHLGSTPIRWPSGSAQSLDHAQTGWPLNGSHKNVACNRCHAKPSPKGGTTYLGLSPTCDSCHHDKDAHQGRFGAACNDCHNESDWKQASVKAFNHDIARFQLRGAHVNVACAKCHQDPPKYTGIPFSQCTDCHKDPHAGKLGNACTNCHDDTRWKPVTFKGANARHPGLSLANGHASVACGKCHDRGNLAPPSRGSACVSCHKNVHKAPFGNGCASCHATITWVGLARSIGIAAHPKTAYPLTGKHGDVACTSCHKPNVPAEARYRKLAFGRCADCHQDKHNGEFARMDSGECGRCHTTSGYRPTLFGVDQHASLAFTLAGKHAAAPCSSCHKNARPLLDLHVAKQACADCHANPHGDQFAAEMAKGGCAQCHEAAGWNIPKIDHKIWPLTGAHASTPCDSCHHPSAEDRKAGRGASYRGVPRNCAGCHEDKHLGQFRLTQPVYECDKCHATASFKIPKFDHQGIAGWALTGAHATTACDKCHANATIAGEHAPSVRWRLTSAATECSFCHANPHKEHLKTSPTVTAAATDTASAKSFTETVPCAACHSTTAWRAKDATGGAVKFDHSTTGFPLTGQHSKTSCVSCHNGSTTKRDCVTCHSDFHRGRLSQSCDKCHNALDWKNTRPLEIHRNTRFPLTGMHVLADCTQCHVRANENKFTDAPAECYACHQQDYQRPGIFPHVGTATTPPLPRDCSMCHRAVAWVPVNVPPGLGTTASALQEQTAPANHDVRFPISFGLHRSAACSDCHANVQMPRAVRCVGCHAHDATNIAQEHKRPVATDGASCMSCHPAGVRR